MVRVFNSTRDFHQNQVAPFPSRDDGRLGPEYKGTAADVENEPVVLVGYGWMMPYLEPGQGDLASHVLVLFLRGPCSIHAYGTLKFLPAHRCS